MLQSGSKFVNGYLLLFFNQIFTSNDVYDCSLGYILSVVPHATIF